MTDDSCRFRFRARRARVRARARPFSGRQARRHPGPEVPAGLQSDDPQLPPRRHRIRHRRAAARRLREDGRRESRTSAQRGSAGRVPVEDEVGTVPGPHHGTGDEPRAGRRADRRRAVPGRRACRRTKISRSVVGAVDAGLAGGEGRHPAGRSDRRRSTAAPSTRGRTSTSRSATRPNREVAIGLLRNGSSDAQRHAGAAPGRAASRSATSACCRTCIRTSASVNAGEPADKAGLKAGDVVARRRRRADHLLAAAARTRSAQASRAADHAVASCATAQTDDDSGRRRDKRGRIGAARHRHRRRDARASSPGSSRRSDERAEERRVRAA